MVLRRVIILVVILGVAAAVSYWGKRPAVVVDEFPGVGKPLFTLEEVGRLTRLEVKGKNSTDAVVVERKDDGRWLVASQDNFPADGGVLTRFFDNLTESRRERLVSSRDEDLQELGLDSGAARVALFARDEAVGEIVMGENRPSGGQFVAIDGKVPAWLMGRALHVPFEGAEWELKTLVDVKSEEVTRVESRLGDNTFFVVTRDEKDTITVEGLGESEEVEANAARGVTRALEALRYTKKSKLADLDASRKGAISEREVVLGLRDGRSYTVEVASFQESKDAAKQYLLAVRETVPAGHGDAAVIQEAEQLGALMDLWRFEVSDYIAKKFLSERKDLVTQKK